jgi:hypothetical protein
VAEVEKDYWISAYDIKERLQSVIFSDSEPGEAPPAKPKVPPAEPKVPPAEPKEPPKGGENGDGDEGDEVVFKTQEEVNQFVGKARKQARGAEANRWLKVLGVETEEEAAKLLKEAEKIKESQMSDAEKAQAEIDRLKKEARKATTLEEENEQLNKAVETQLGSRIKALDPPEYLLSLMEDMEPVKALNFLSEHEDELVKAKMQLRVPETGGDGKGKQKAQTDEEKEARKEDLKRRYRIT